MPVSGKALFLYEQDPGPGREDDKLLLDKAFVTIANTDITPFYATAGRIYTPFGQYESYTVTDPAAHKGKFSLIAEYIAALDEFQPGEISAISNGKLKPQSFNLEGAYHFILAGKDSTFALGYQKSKDMYLNDTELAYYEQAWVTTFSTAIYDNTTIAAEWAHITAYDEVKASRLSRKETFDDADAIQVKLSYEF